MKYFCALQISVKQLSKNLGKWPSIIIDFGGRTKKTFGDLPGYLFGGGKSQEAVLWIMNKNMVKYYTWL